MNNKKSSILIVDDDAGMAETLADILNDMSYDITVAGDGSRAIEILKKRAYDVALIDIKMPGINGVETFKEVKRICPSLRVIMMTAYSVEDLVKEALEEGAYGILYKPLDINKVVELIENAEKGTFILVVDDDPATCETLKDVLMEKSYNVNVAYNGEDAIRLVKEDKLDIVFIDVKLPVLNGLETYLAIKEVNPKITAIMMTGYRQKVAELVDEALRKSAYTCIYKPLDMNKVLTLMDEICRQRRTGTSKKPIQGGDEHD